VLWENRSRIEGVFFGARPRGVRAPPGPLCLAVGDRTSACARKRVRNRRKSPL